MNKNLENKRKTVILIDDKLKIEKIISEIFYQNSNIEEIIDPNMVHIFYGNWNIFDECWAIGEEIADRFSKEGKIAGATYVRVVNTEYSNHKFFKLPNNDINDYYVEVQALDDETIQNIKADFLKETQRDLEKDKFKNKIKYQNYVYVILDEPIYSHSKEKCNTTNTIIFTPNEAYLINIGYPLISDITYDKIKEQLEVAYQDYINNKSLQLRKIK